MGNELVTTALDTVYLYSWWWMAVPVGLGLLLIIIGAGLHEDLSLIIGFVVLLGGGFFTAMINGAGSMTYDEELMRADVSEQLQIEEVVQDGDWYLGKGPEGEFIRFALVEQDGAENTYSVLVEK